MEKFTELLNEVGAWIVQDGLKIVFGLLFFFIFCKVINLLFKKLDQKMEKKNVEITVRRLTVSWVRRIIKFVGFVTLISYLGVETSGIAAAITSIGLTVGLALQGSLSNLAGGVVIILMRPFKVGDFIEVNGQSGTVDKIELFHTYLTTGDNRQVILANAQTANATIVNYSTKETRRVELTFSISYDNDFKKAKQLLFDIMDKYDIILKDPAPFVNISNHNASSIDLIVRFWTRNEDYWTAKWQMLEDVKSVFDANNIEIPYPQMDVHIKNQPECEEITK